MKNMTILLFTFASATLQAEVFKCSDLSGKTFYQSTPCQPREKAKQLDIKTDPKMEADAKVRLDALESEMEAEKAKQLRAAKEEYEQKLRTEQINALNRNAFAQQQQAIEERRLAEAIEQQNVLNNRPILLFPPNQFALPQSQHQRNEPAFNRNWPAIQNTDPRYKDHPNH